MFIAAKCSLKHKCETVKKHDLLFINTYNRWQIAVVYSRRNNTFWDMLLLENNQHCCGKSNSASWWDTSHHPDVDYFPIAECP